MMLTIGYLFEVMIEKGSFFEIYSILLYDQIDALLTLVAVRESSLLLVYRV